MRIAHRLPQVRTTVGSTEHLEPYYMMSLR